MCVNVCVCVGGGVSSDVGVKVFNIYQEIVTVATTQPRKRVVFDGCLW